MAKGISKETALGLTDAVRELEGRSCAEVVVEIRARSGSYAHADARFGAIVAFLALIVLLFSKWSFAPAWVVIDTALAYAIGTFTSRGSNWVRRMMTSERERAAQVRHGRPRGAHAHRGEICVGELQRRDVEAVASRQHLLRRPAELDHQLAVKPLR